MCVLVVDLNVKRLIFLDRPHFHEAPCIFGRRIMNFSCFGKMEGSVLIIFVRDFGCTLFSKTRLKMRLLRVATIFGKKVRKCGIFYGGSQI